MEQRHDCRSHLANYEVRYNVNYLSSLLKKLGLSYQKARFISDRQEEEAYQVARKKWLEETLPAIIKKAKEDNSVVLFSVWFVLVPCGDHWRERGHR